MGAYISELKTGLEHTLNRTVLSWWSIIGVIYLLLIVFIIYRYVPRVLRIIVSLLIFIIVIDICHLVVFRTGVGTAVPFLKTIFRYSVFTGLAQLCVGTPIADGFLWAQATIDALLLKAFDGILSAWHAVFG